MSESSDAFFEYLKGIQICNELENDNNTFAKLLYDILIKITTFRFYYNREYEFKLKSSSGKIRSLKVLLCVDRTILKIKRVSIERFRLNEYCDISHIPETMTIEHNDFNFDIFFNFDEKIITNIVNMHISKDKTYIQVYKPLSIRIY